MADSQTDDVRRWGEAAVLFANFAGWRQSDAKVKDETRKICEQLAAVSTGGQSAGRPKRGGDARSGQER